MCVLTCTSCQGSQSSLLDLFGRERLAHSKHSIQLSCYCIVRTVRFACSHEEPKDIFSKVLLTPLSTAHAMSPVFFLSSPLMRRQSRLTWIAPFWTLSLRLPRDCEPNWGCQAQFVLTMVIRLTAVRKVKLQLGYSCTLSSLQNTNKYEVSQYWVNT